MLAGHAEGAGAAGGRGGLHRLGEGLRQGGDDQGSRLLLRFPRVQEEQGKRHDADDAEHLAFLRVAKQAGGHLRRGPRGPLRAAPGERDASPAQWADKRGFELFPEKGYESITLTCCKNTKNVDIPKLNSLLKKKHSCVIDGGYGKIKGTSFRISTMGDETTENIVAVARLDRRVPARSRNGRAGEGALISAVPALR